MNNESRFVVDTNVLLHAANPEVAEFTDSVNFLKAFSANGCTIVIDEGFSLDEGVNQSLIGGEYATVSRESLGIEIVTEAMLDGRIVFVPHKVDASLRKFVLTIKKPRDRTFVKVARNGDADLISHDYEDFTVKFRVDARDKFRICIQSAAEALVA